MMSRHHFQRTRHHRAARFTRIEELLFVHFLRHRVVADEDDFGAFVVAFQEQIQQQEEALREFLDVLIHRTGDVHQTEHHRLRRRHRLLQMQVVAQVVRIEKRHAFDPAAQLRQLVLDPPRRHLVTGAFGQYKIVFERGHPMSRAAGQRNASRLGDAQRTHHIQFRRHAIVRKTRMHAFEAVGASKVPFDEVRQLEILEHHVEELVLRQLENEVVVAFAAVGCTAATATAASGRARHPIAGNEFRLPG